MRGATRGQLKAQNKGGTFLSANATRPPTKCVLFSGPGTQQTWTPRCLHCAVWERRLLQTLGGPPGWDRKASRRGQA